MMHQVIDRNTSRWCILRTSGGKTLALTESLNKAGIAAWTPRRTFKRPKPGRCAMIDGRKPTVEIEAPILPTFVFAPAAHIADLAFASGDPACRHPGFTIMRDVGRYPLVSDRAVAGLRQAEEAATEAIERQREAETREERRRIRAAAAKTERDRRKLLRAEYREFAEGASVAVKDVAALAGMTGVIKSSDGRTAVVAFGGLLTMEVEAWQIVLDQVQGDHSVAVK